MAVRTNPKVVRARSAAWRRSCPARPVIFFVGRNGPEFVFSRPAQAMRFSRIIEIGSVCCGPPALSQSEKRTIDGVVFDDAVIWLIGEEHIAVPIDGRTFREGVAFPPRTSTFAPSARRSARSGLRNEAQGK